MKLENINASKLHADIKMCKHKKWGKYIKKNHSKDKTQPAFTCSKLTIETLEQGVKYVQS